MSDDTENKNVTGNGKAIAGAVLLVVGAVLLIERFINIDIELWPLWLVGWGVFAGVRTRFHNPISFILIFLGSVLLLTTNIPDGDRVAWPIIIIVVGLWMVLRRNHSFDNTFWQKRFGNKWDRHNYKWEKWDKKNYNWNNPYNQPKDETTTGVPSDGSADQGNPGPKPTGDDYLDAVSVFGGVKKNILSKDFKGGEIVNIFGGAELDFTQADINGRVVIDITQIFGGTKIIVPPHWQVVSDIAAVFAGFDDKRMKITAESNNKILVLTGVSIFAGIDIRSY
jgi:predicted membrane protein